MSSRIANRTWLNISHCVYLLICAAYVAWMYPTSWPACLLLANSWVMVAFMPSAWRQKGIGEITFLFMALIASSIQWYLHGNDSESIDGLSRIIIVTLVLVLVPNRPGLVRPLAMLVALELLLLNAMQELSLALIFGLSLFALSALFLDAWLRHQYTSSIGVRIRNRWSKAPWLSMAQNLLLLLLLAFPVAHVIKSVGKQHLVNIQRELPGSQGGAVSNISLDNQLHIGSARWTDQDSYVVARYFPDRSETLSDKNPTYVRALAVPSLVIEDNGQISWRSPRAATPYRGPEIDPIPLGSGATLIRFRSGDNIMLRPDGAEIPMINNFYFDSEENLYTNEQDLSVIRYRCRPSKETFSRTQRNTQRQDAPYLEVPDRLMRLFQIHIPQLEQWRVLSPDQTAQQIRLYLHRRCKYSTKDLPIPENKEASCIELFLFGDRNQRIGHCQYFSSAATLLMRACGHLSRPVFGFSSTELGPEAKSVILRAWHGHAWCEFINASGNWQRMDPTPGGYLQQRIDPSKIAETQEEVLAGLDESDQSISYTPFIIIFACLCGMSIFIILMRPSDRPLALSARQRELSKQQQALLSCAKQLGISVKDSHTLSDIVYQVELRCGMNLKPQLQDHLAALYNHAEIPENWPIDSILSAARQRQQQQQAPKKSDLSQPT